MPAHRVACFYGVDTPTRGELIASNHSHRRDPAIRGGRFARLSFVNSLRKAVGDDERHEYCYACYTGDYPTDIPSNLIQIESAALRTRCLRCRCNSMAPASPSPKL